MSRQTIDITDAARYFVYLSYHKRCYSLNSRKLEAMLYLAQGWSYAWDGEPLYDDEITATAAGPRNAKVEEILGKFSHDEIPEEEGSDNIKDKSIKETINAVWRDYGRRSLRSLNDEIFAQAPFAQAQKQKTAVNDENLKNFFVSSYA